MVVKASNYISTASGGVDAHIQSRNKTSDCTTCNGSKQWRNVRFVDERFQHFGALPHKQGNGKGYGKQEGLDCILLVAKKKCSYTQWYVDNKGHVTNGKAQFVLDHCGNTIDARWSKLVTENKYFVGQAVQNAQKYHYDTINNKSKCDFHRCFVCESSLMICVGYACSRFRLRAPAFEFDYAQNDTGRP